MAILLGVLVAAAYGSGDFLGGRASRDAPAVGVLWFSQLAALVVIVGAVVITGGQTPGRDLLIGAGAGLASAVGLGCLYRGLATGRMGVVAPVTAVVAAVIPVGWGLARGERPSVLVLVGVVIAVGAGGIVAHEPDFPDEAPTGAPRTALLLALAAGVTFAAAFIGFSEVGDDSGTWPLLTARLTAVAVIGTAVVVETRRRRGSVLPRDHPRPLAVVAGLLEAVATVALLAAVRRGLLVVVAPLAALAPAFTVVWAWSILREPVTRLQLVGLGCSLAGLALIAAG